jgi:lactoylglutathione lyase
MPHPEEPTAPDVNVVEAVPFLHVTDIEASLRFYVAGLGGKVVNEWRPEGRVRWCKLSLGGARLMLQEYLKSGTSGTRPASLLGQGVRICLFCKDATRIYEELIGRSVAASKPFVGNGLWVTSVIDPDGYLLDFESPTDLPEDTVFGEQP